MVSVTTVAVRILGQNLPGLRFCEHEAVHVGVQRETREHIIDPVPGDAAEAVFSFTINVVRSDDGQIDFRGNVVQGKRGARFIYLSWGDLLPDGRFHMFRRAKMQLSALADLDLAAAAETGTVVEAVVNLTGARGQPICASLRPPQITWRTYEQA
jgi:hypothetical protein